MSENQVIRIKDIARLAGVSVGTVDRVIHKRGKVSEEAQKKVEAVLKTANYKPNIIARTLGSKKSLKIIALIPDAKQDDYWGLAQSGIDQSIEEWAHYGIQIDTYFFDLYNSDAFGKVAEAAVKEKPDGILLAPIFHKQSLKLFKQLKINNIPYVLFNTNIPDSNPLCFIGQDLYQSGRVAAELLSFKMAAIRIAILHIYERLENSVHLKSKEKGVYDFFTDNNCTIKSYDIKAADDISLEADILKIIKTFEPAGFFVSTSKATHLVADILEKNNLKHVHLVGFDLLEKNIHFLKKGTIDFLINQNPKRMAQMGATHLINNLLFNKELPTLDLFPLEVITLQNVDSYIQSRIH